VRVLALSAFDDADYVAGLLNAGAAGYLLKEEAAHTVIDAIRGVACGQTGYFSPSVAAQVAAQARGETQVLNGLTAGEVAVVQLVADGQSNRAIGAALGISEKAVEKRLQRVFEKWEVKSRTEAAVRAVREGLILR